MTFWCGFAIGALVAVVVMTAWSVLSAYVKGYKMITVDDKYILRIIASLCLCDHMGDVADDIDKVLRDIEFDPGEWDTLSELLDKLGKQGVTTIWGTEIIDE